jgi:peptidoglycan/LPS O-acetylase OafA/YrhL
LFIGINLAFWWVFQRQRGYPSPVPLVPRYLFFLQNFASKQAWFFAESWSLSVEEWFYLLFPLGLFLGLRLFRVPFGRLYWTLAAAMIALPGVLRWLTLSQEDWANGITKVVIYRPDSIAVGLAAVAISRRYSVAWARAVSPAAAVGLALLAGSFLYMGFGDPEHSGLARTFLPLVISIGCAFLLPWASTRTSLGGRAISAPVRAVARWSYSLYLVNLMLSSTVLSHMQFHYGTAVGIISYVASCLLASAAIYHWFEAPILRWRDGNIYLGGGPSPLSRA